MQSIDTFVMSLGNIAQMKPEVLEYFNVSGYVKMAARAYSVPESVIVPDQKVQEIQEAQAAQAMQQQNLDQAGQEADIANKMSN